VGTKRKSIELSKPERMAFLESQKTIIIVSNSKEGYPHPMPMWFSFDDDETIYCTTFGKSQKVLNYRRDPKASLLVESGTEYAELKGVVYNARAEIIEATDQVVETLVRINTRGRSVSEEERRALTGAVLKTAEKRVVLKFAPIKIISWDHSKLGGRY